MGLRTILFYLVLLSLLSTSIGSYFYYRSLKVSYSLATDQKAAQRVGDIKNHLANFTAEQLKPVRALAGLQEISQALMETSPETLEQANRMLDHFKRSLSVDVCYLMDKNGATIGSSNRLDRDSFVGDNFAFRPYFSQAMRGTPATYMALGATSAKRGVYFSYPVLDLEQRQPIGVAVIKASTAPIEEQFPELANQALLLVAPSGIVFIASRQEWLFHSLWPLSPAEIQELERSRQFGTGPWPWLGLSPIEGKRLMEGGGAEYVVTEQTLDDFAGWRVIYLRDVPSQFAAMLMPALRTTGIFIIPIFLMIGLAVFFLYRKAYLEIGKRKAMQIALTESEERYRTLYMQTPALLHSIDPSGRMVSVSDYWVETLGYDRSEVLGRKITDFLTEESKKYAQETVIPAFLETGVCKNISYQFKKKNGQIINILLSAIAERDMSGAIVRSLAILVDITELTAIKEAEQRLRNLSASILTGQERERAAIARELHDELGQSLTAMKMDAVWLDEQLRQVDSKVQERARSICDIIDHTIDEVRTMALRLRPQVLDDLGLIAALEWLVDDFEKRSSISCTFKNKAADTIDDNIATVIYRIAQEALTNTARHSEASHCQVTLSCEQGNMRLEVTDNGKGFDKEQLSSQQGLGLTGIRERAGLINASLTIESTPGQGTKVILEMKSLCPEH